MPEPHDLADTNTGEVAQAAARVLRALEGIQYGAVEIVIHAGRIVQIERKEKVRLEPPRETAPAVNHFFHSTSQLASF
ncbi:MAG: YezD family protein [Gammaproteobacteria bacterium]|nr:YezD family protein [Gammaproteobacteria bacterium]